MTNSLFNAVKSNNNSIKLESEIVTDEITDRISNAFDYTFSGKISTLIDIPKFPDNFQIGLIVGSSGSGKSNLLKLFGDVSKNEWQKDLCIASHFDSFDDASAKFGAVGLNSIPTWLKPYHVLSNGEKFRADMARSLHSNAVIDEFTSVVNRECAISCSASISKYIRHNNLKNVVFASCHDDIIDYLQPDWIYNTDKKELLVGRCASKRPQIILEVNQCSKQVWQMFKSYHYLSADLNVSSDCYLFTYNMLPVGFGAILPMPGRFPNVLNLDDDRLCVSEHRIVVLPDYQGIGIGNKISEYLGELYLSQGYRYFGKTANPRMGEHRQRSSKWRPTSHNLRKPQTINYKHLKKTHAIRKLGRATSEISALMYLSRLCYSHEYIGDENTNIGEKRFNRSNSIKLF